MMMMGVEQLSFQKLCEKKHILDDTLGKFSAFGQTKNYFLGNIIFESLHMN